MPPRKRKVVYPPSRSAKPAVPGGPVGAPIVPRTVVAIERDALVARTDLSVGSRVQILGTGLYAGENGVVERMLSGVIPSAMVRTDAGRTRPVRTIDLALLPGEQRPQA